MASHVVAKSVKDSGHYPQEEAPEEMLALLIPFLKGSEVD